MVDVLSLKNALKECKETKKEIAYAMVTSKVEYANLSQNAQQNQNGTKKNLDVIVLYQENI